MVFVRAVCVFSEKIFSSGFFLSRNFCVSRGSAADTMYGLPRMVTPFPTANVNIAPSSTSDTCFAFSLITSQGRCAVRQQICARCFGGPCRLDCIASNCWRVQGLIALNVSSSIFRSLMNRWTSDKLEFLTVIATSGKRFAAPRTSPTFVSAVDHFHFPLCTLERISVGNSFPYCRTNSTAAMILFPCLADIPMKGYPPLRFFATCSLFSELRFKLW